MATKRLILPTKFTITVTAGDGEFETGIIVGTIRRIVVKAPSGPAANGVVKLRDDDNALDIFQEPEPGDPEVDLKFFQFALEIPVNGKYKWVIKDATRDGDYTGYFILEERPRTV